MLQSNSRTLGYPDIQNQIDNRCVHDNRTEFIGSDFVRLLAQMGMEDVCTSVCNPQSNAICERMHQTIIDILGVVVYIPILHIHRTMMI